MTAAPAQTPMKEDIGALIGQFIVDETPMVSALLSTAYNHYAPALLKMFESPAAVADQVKSVLSKGSAWIKDQKLALSVPSGLLADLMHELDKTKPGLLKAIEDEVDRDVVAASKALGIIPK